MTTNANKTAPSATGNVKTSHNESEVSRIIKAVMTSAATDNTRQLTLTVSLANDYSALTSMLNLKKMFSLSGKDKTEKFDHELSVISDDFAKAVKEYNVAKAAKPEKGASDKQREDHVIAVDAMLRKIKAARIMFERALKSCAAFHDMKATKVILSSAGTPCIIVKAVDPDDKDDTVKIRMSGNELFRKGDEAIKASLGKKAAARTSNPKLAGLDNAAKSMASALGSIKAEDKSKGIADTFAGEVEKNAFAVLKELFAMQFLFNGHLDVEAVKRYAAETYGKDVVTPVKAPDRKTA